MPRRLVSAAHSLVRLSRIYQLCSAFRSSGIARCQQARRDHLGSYRNRPQASIPLRAAGPAVVGVYCCGRQHRAVPLEPGPTPIS